MELCQTCQKEKIVMRVTKTLEGKQGKLVVHNVPATTCECGEQMAFRPLLIMEDKLKKIDAPILHIDYNQLEKDYESITIEELIGLK